MSSTAKQIPGDFKVTRPTGKDGVAEERSAYSTDPAPPRDGARHVFVDETPYGLSVRFVGPSPDRLYWPEARPLLDRVRDRLRLGLVGKHRVYDLKDSCSSPGRGGV